MKEIRTLIGVSLQQLTALFAVVPVIDEMISTKGKMTANDNPWWCYYEATFPDGLPCWFCVQKEKMQNRALELLVIKKVQLQRDNLFLVQLIISELQEVEVIYGDSFQKLSAREDDSPGIITVRPAILSRIEKALDFATKAEPIHVLPKN